MKKLLLIAFLSCATWSLSQSSYSRAKVHADSKGLQTLAELGIGIDHGTIKRETFFISDFSTDEITTMRNAGFTVDILIDDVQAFYVNQNKVEETVAKNVNCPGGAGGTNTFTPEVPSNFNLGSMGGFYTYQEFLDEIDAMAAQYPSLITPKAPISTFQTHEGRPIYFLKISDNPSTDEAEPEVLYSSIHHAREPNSLSEVIFYMWYLLENYGSNQEIQYLVNNTEMYFVPMINPDGYVYNVTQSPNGGGLWRKNRRNNGNGTFGVDLNRNYSYQWNTTGVSPNPGNDTYPGTAPFSEPETQAMKWLCENRDFSFAFNAHTYANEILHPVGATDAEFAVDHDYFQAFTGHMVQFNGYANRKSSDLYPASGDSDDYMYKVDTVIKPKIFAMTPEVSNEQGGFWPAASAITGICQDMVFPNLILSHLTHQYLVVEDTDPSSIATTTGNFNHSAYRLGQVGGPIQITIQPLIGIASVGGGFSHDLAIMGTGAGTISYVLNPTIQFGDIIQYVLETNYNGWTKRDTITKTFGSITSQILDEANNNVNWTGTWATTTAEFVSPSNSFTDSPTGDYANSSNKTYTFNQTIDLTNVTDAAVRFYAKWEIENDYDYAQFQVSTDNGVTWIGQCGQYTNLGNSANGSAQPQDEPIYDGTQADWVLEEISLSDYIGQSIKMRFVMEADGGVRADGFYFDDFEVLYNIDFTSVSEETIGNLVVVPNPANLAATISFNKPVQTGVLTVYSLSGQLVAQQKITELTNKIIFDTKIWSEGIYNVVYSSESETTTPIKLVVIH